MDVYINAINSTHDFYLRFFYVANSRRLFLIGSLSFET